MYSGYLIKVGNYTIPMRYMKNYSGIRHVMDLDSYQDADGELHRNALEHNRFEVNFDTPRAMTNIEIEELLRNIRQNYVEPKERKVSASIYDFEKGEYVNCYLYLADLTFPIYLIDGNIIKFESISFQFTSY